MSNVVVSISYDASTELVMVTLRGIAVAQDVIRSLDAIAGFVEQYSASKVLIDATEFEHGYPAIEIIDVVSHAAKRLSDLIVARVVNCRGYMDDLLLQKARRFQINAQNFESFCSAKQWLLSH